ncbi:cytochrome P450 2M1-like [Oratosquilla oratoria]|uniref:cytochrome P450 2M1-like n=1 Tax=Oratosquilla oratoria TaxID=337810 RepID=UPI003F76A868
MATRSTYLPTILCGILIHICALWLFPLDSVTPAWEIFSNSTVDILNLLKKFAPSTLRRTLVSALVTSCLALLAYLWKNPSSLPPGPRGLPVVGYLPWLDPKAPYLTLSALTKKYGNVFSVQLGNVPTVVIADANIMRNTFSLESTTGRAPLFLTHGIMKSQGVTSEYPEKTSCLPECCGYSYPESNVLTWRGEKRAESKDVSLR